MCPQNQANNHKPTKWFCLYVNMTLMYNWQASIASETLSGVPQSRFRYIYLFIYLFMGYVRPLFSPALLIT